MISEHIDSFRDSPGAELAGSQKERSSRQVLDAFLEYSREAASAFFQWIKSESRSIAANQLTLATGETDNFAEALMEAAQKLREQYHSPADLIETGSKGVMRLSKKIRETSPQKIAEEMAEIARRQPGIFLGTAVITGILLGQLLSPPNGREKFRELFQEPESLVEYSAGMDEEEFHEPH